MAEELKRTALYDEHLRLHGRIVPFAGWELPVQYDDLGPTVEHNAVRTAAGLRRAAPAQRDHATSSSAAAIDSSAL